MTTLESETVSLEASEDLIAVRQQARTFCVRCGFGLTDQTKLVTATSELARNALTHGGGGTALIERIESDERCGVRITFQDFGPGIADMKMAMTSGYSTRGGLGLGLPGSKRLVHEFDIESNAGKGTRVTIVRWG